MRRRERRQTPAPPHGGQQNTPLSKGHKRLSTLKAAFSVKASQVAQDQVGTGSQRPESRGPETRVQRPRDPGTRDQGPESRDPETRDFGQYQNIINM